MVKIAKKIFEIFIFDFKLISIKKGKKEFITKKVNLDKKKPNRVILNKFEEDQYIICVVLYSTNYDTSNEFPPISTSGQSI